MKKSVGDARDCTRPLLQNGKNRSKRPSVLLGHNVVRPIPETPLGQQVLASHHNIFSLDEERFGLFKHIGSKLFKTTE